MSEPMSEHVSCGRPGCNDLERSLRARLANVATAAGVANDEHLADAILDKLDRQALRIAYLEGEVLDHENAEAEVCGEDYSLKETFDAMVRQIDCHIDTINRVTFARDRLAAENAELKARLKELEYRDSL